MNRAVVDGVTLEYEDTGSGDPVLCIHGVFIADTFRPLATERRLARRYRLIRYHRRGYAGSSAAAGAPAGLAVHAADCRRLLSHLGLTRAHVVGHSTGGTIALELALAEPDLVHTLALIEPALAVGESAESYRQSLTHSIRRFRDAGPAVALDESLELRWPSYREPLQRLLPGAFEQAVADAPTYFEADVPIALELRLGEAEARRIAQPVLVVLGARSVALHPRFAETHQLLLDWLPNSEGFVVPEATHFVQLDDPGLVAESLARFYAYHPIL